MGFAGSSCYLREVGGSIWGVLELEDVWEVQPVMGPCKQSRQSSEIVKRTFSTLDEELLPIVYKHQIRPHLEYIWQCYMQSQVCG